MVRSPSGRKEELFRRTLGDVRGLVRPANGALGGDAKLKPAQADTSERQRGLHSCGKDEKGS